MKSKAKLPVWKQAEALGTARFTKDHYSVESLVYGVQYEISRAFDLGHKAGAKAARAKLKAKKAK